MHEGTHTTRAQMQIRYRYRQLVGYMFVFTYLHTYITLDLHTCLHTYQHAYMHTYKYANTQTHTHTHPHIYIYIYICIYTQIYIYIYICAHTHTRKIYITVSLSLSVHVAWWGLIESLDMHQNHCNVHWVDVGILSRLVSADIEGKLHRQETAEAIAMLEQQRATPSEAAWRRWTMNAFSCSGLGLD